MPLFQSFVISKHLKTLDKQAVQAAFLKFKAHFHNPAIQKNIRNSKEAQYQEGFLNDLFVNILIHNKIQQKIIISPPNIKMEMTAKKQMELLLLMDK